MIALHPVSLAIPLTKNMTVSQSSSTTLVARRLLTLLEHQKSRCISLFSAPTLARSASCTPWIDPLPLPQKLFFRTTVSSYCR